VDGRIGESQAIGAALGQDGIVQQTDPLVDGPVVGDDRAVASAKLRDHLADVNRLLGGEMPQPEVIEDAGAGASRRRKPSWPCRHPAKGPMAGDVPR